jgi:hypothetical protein
LLPSRTTRSPPASRTAFPSRTALTAWPASPLLAASSSWAAFSLWAASAFWAALSSWAAFSLWASWAAFALHSPGPGVALRPGGAACTAWAAFAVHSPGPGVALRPAGALRPGGAACTAWAAERLRRVGGRDDVAFGAVDVGDVHRLRSRRLDLQVEDMCGRHHDRARRIVLLGEHHALVVVGEVRSLDAAAGVEAHDRRIEVVTGVELRGDRNGPEHEQPGRREPRPTPPEPEPPPGPVTGHAELAAQLLGQEIRRPLAPLDRSDHGPRRAAGPELPRLRRKLVTPALEVRQRREPRPAALEVRAHGQRRNGEHGEDAQRESEREQAIVLSELPDRGRPEGTNDHLHTESAEAVRRGWRSPARSPRAPG